MTIIKKVQVCMILCLVFLISLLAIMGFSSASEVNVTMVVAGDAAGNMYALDVSSGTQLWNASIGGDTRSVAVSDDGQFIVIGTNENVVMLIKNGTKLWTKPLGVNPTDPLPPFQYDTKLVSVSGDGRYILVAHNDGKVHLYDDEGVEIWNNTFSATSIAIASDGKSAAAGGSTGIRYYSVGANAIWDSSDSTPAWNVSDASIRKVAISSNGRYIVAGGRSDEYARLYEDTGVGVAIWSYRNIAGRISVDISRDGMSIAVGNDDSSDYYGAQLAYFWIGNDGVWTTADSTPVWTFRASSNPADDVRTVAFSRSGRYIASGGSGNYAHTFLHQIGSSTPMYNSTPWGHEDETIDVSFDGRYIVAADTQTAAVRLYDTQGATTPLWTCTTAYPIRSVAIISTQREDSIWVPSAEGVLVAGALTVGITSGVSAVASAVSNPENFPSISLAQKINDVLPDSVKKWLESFISSKTGEPIEHRVGMLFVFTKQEIFSIAVSLSVITFAFSYAKAETLDQILSLVPIVLVTAIIVDFVKDLVRDMVARSQGVWSEYRLWYIGLAMFLVSSIAFKAPFSSPSRIKHHSPTLTTRKVGILSLTAILVPLVFALIFYLLLVNGFTLIGNMGIVICLTAAFFDTIPIPPMNGKDIYDWNKVLWLIFFITCFALYALSLLLL